MEQKLEKFQDEEEKQLIEQKKSNLIFFDIPELDSENLEERIAHDREAFFTLYDIEEDNYDEETVQNMYRVGAKKEGKTRPMIVKFLDEETKMKYLKESRDLALEINGTDTRIYVSQDMTKNQRAKLKKLTAEKKERNKKGEKLVIKNLQLVKRNFRKEDEKVKDGPPVRVSYRSLYVRK